MDTIRELEMIRDYSPVDEWTAPLIDGEERVSAEGLNWFDAETPNLLSDEALLNAIAGGAVWAMESLYQRYSRSLYSLIYHMVDQGVEASTVALIKRFQGPYCTTSNGIEQGFIAQQVWSFGIKPV